MQHKQRARRAPRIRLGTPTIAGVAAFAILLPAYLATAAPDLTLWDSSELATAAHTLGIPHPPGTPLWVLIANVFGKLFANTGPARSITMFSVVATALACSLGAVMSARWIGGRGAVAAAVSAGTMFTVWNNATEAEVYAAALLASVAMLYAGERAGRVDVADTERERWRLMLAFLSGIAVPLHLSALVALPAALTLAWRGSRPRIANVIAIIALFAVGISSIAFLPIRAQHAPLLNSGNPESLSAMLEVLQRKQFDVPGLWPRRAPLWLQLGNVFQWADWQVAFGLSPQVGPSWRRTPLTLIWAWFALLGIRALFRHEKRIGRGLTVLAISGTVAVALWLNLRAGPSYGAGVLPIDALHEARERDYFFALGFWCWGLLAGIGVSAIAQTVAKRVAITKGERLANVIAIPLIAIAALPMIANVSATNRTVEPLATLPRTFARLLLDAVPINGVLITAGDNDTFLPWYLQRVEGYRSDVTIVAAPLLGARWYREEMKNSGVFAGDMVANWYGTGQALATVGREAYVSNRALRVSIMVSATNRTAVDESSGWLLEGMVYAPSPLVAAGEIGLNVGSMARAQNAIPMGALTPLPESADPMARGIQQYLRCTEVQGAADSLLVGRCNGG